MAKGIFFTLAKLAKVIFALGGSQLVLVVKRLPSVITPFFSKDTPKKLLDSVFTAVLRTFYAESQDLAKRKIIWLTEICPL